MNALIVDCDLCHATAIIHANPSLGAPAGPFVRAGGPPRVQRAGCVECKKDKAPCAKCDSLTLIVVTSPTMRRMWSPETEEREDDLRRPLYRCASCSFTYLGHVREPDPAYAPGSWQCRACSFHLQKNVITTQDGGVAPDRSTESEPCPNGCGPLVPVTWKEECEAFARGTEQLAEKLAGLKRGLRALTRYRPESSGSVATLMVRRDGADYVLWSDIEKHLEAK